MMAGKVGVLVFEIISKLDGHFLMTALTPKDLKPNPQRWDTHFPFFGKGYQVSAKTILFYPKWCPPGGQLMH